MKIITLVLGAITALLGLALFVGGIWLASLGGAWFYLIAGALLTVAGIGMARRAAYALWLAFLVLLYSLVWAFYEVGLDFWQLVPRLLVFIGIAMVFASLAPTLKTSSGQRALGGKASAAIAVICLVTLVGFIAGMFHPHPSVVADDDTSAAIIKSDAGQENGNDWPAWGRSTQGERFAQFEQINKDNVDQLEVAWTYRTGDLATGGAEYQVTPLKVDDTVYLCTPMSKVIALNATTGKEKWRFDPQPKITESVQGWKRCRGVGYTDLGPRKQTAFADSVVHSADDNDTAAQDDANTSDSQIDNALRASSAPSCRRRIIETTIDARLLALDADTGKLCTDFGDGGYVDLRKGLTPTPAASQEGTYNVTSAPLVADGVILVGGRLNDNLSIDEPSGVVRGFDAETGKLIWAWDAARKTSKPLPPGETYAPETPNFWGTAAYDPKLGLAYFPTGNQTPDFWTGNRHPYSNEYNDSIVAVDLQTGEERWHFRTANIDQFDYDVSSQPILYDLPREDGSTTPVLIQLTKRGEIFVLDRRNGKPVFPVEQRQVPTDGMPGMQIASTQPFSALSVGTTPLKETDMWGATPLDQLYCRIQFKQMRWEGPFTPLSDKKRTLIYPGYYGGFNWGGGAIDASTGTLIVNDIRMAQWGRFIKQEVAESTGLKPSTEGEYSTQTGTPWGVERSMFVSPLGVPCFKPPFGSMTAIDLTTGKTKWQVPMGTIEDAPVHGFVSGLHIPLGMPTMGGPLVTGGGLTFFHGTLDYYIRALDNDTGEELWRSRLPVGGQGAPMSYIGSDGRQYVVVVDGGATRTGSDENRGDYVIAYALPKAD
ncbi:membrane-bound PQQ-dependent dehydrogenase, glucose/quinate/shikimate family [Chromohalobacter beijerinckii]|uniref:Membrane-bound PQQ-dependent dehydrogenase, glucose/quinate/shikimate family n=1 Tax=Chromohalobacter beijerinckii TaxID=86179 RepID=A0ABV8XC54_9GAMM|nr:membrane-bound PQQ-dependent dehydrogenase, glucose/quinate/shikimate family [Chromohalobacter beijerinckii]MCK0765812.1 membrane-bound PQQ-dependent dehydrogenase, glucose/quinate/shikimate family [Chromohalobacter beijerinckii]